jgi:hypothetical protein
MAKKAVIGTSPKDSSMDKMDRFIQREERKEQQNLRRHGKKDLSRVPFNEWPLKKKLEHLENQSKEEKFKEQYTSYSTWYDAVKKKSGVYPITFVDWTSTSTMKEVLRDMYNKSTSVKEAVSILKNKHGIY